MMTPLQELRNALELTQQELADSIGVWQAQISEHERTGQGIGGQKLLVIADLYRTEMNRLGLTVEDLLRGSRQRGGTPGGKRVA